MQQRFLAILFWAAIADKGIPSWASIGSSLPLSLILLIAGWLASVHAGQQKALGKDHEWEVWREIATGFVAGAVLWFSFNSVSNDIENQRQLDAARIEDLREARTLRLENLRFVRSTIIATRERPEDRLFSGLDLATTQLTQLDLSGAKLVGADLRAAQLQYGNLRGADLSSALLGGADVTRADLTGADLSGAVISRASFAALPKAQQEALGQATDVAESFELVWGDPGPPCWEPTRPPKWPNGFTSPPNSWPCI